METFSLVCSTYSQHLKCVDVCTKICLFFFSIASDGKLQWEEEAHVDRDNSNEVQINAEITLQTITTTHFLLNISYSIQCLLCVRVPTYSDLSVSRPVSVSLYISNGKRKRSSTHCFKYLPSE